MEKKLIADSSPLPKSLINKCKPYFRYALELKQIAPIISYFCQVYGINQGLEIIKAIPQEQVNSNMSQVLMTKQYLISLMNDLEVTKKKLQNENKENIKYQVENYVQAVFMKVDKLEKETLQAAEVVGQEVDIKELKLVYEDYYKCAHFIELIKLFTEDKLMPKDWEVKRKFCLFKAGYGRKEIENGRIPKYGNPFENSELKKKLELEKKETKAKKQRAEDEQRLKALMKISQPNPGKQPQNNANQFNNILPPSKPSNISEKLDLATVTTPQPQPRQTQQRGAAFFKDVTEAKKLGQNAISEMDYNNLRNAVGFLRTAIKTLEKYQQQ